ncbi:gamma-glutamyl-gamma-aminobutyrate hydrolase family protein [Fusibacter ferrireducens]|uniref:Gamma-glutamyl-gamma-aminobutyrate hydrolase family protein n=1 Tax=Fusibacter ferrireducens TaxID=2785058 RepID=A0ABR9ZXX6_9FIRM|nr:gamma-glutamyl-gamma-aminobutyrate hydrolase family protein [Fusibacter ferrireducens]MBF4695322.1 gamma-glutamyl-gamma-aminobutyrate hydrolase family protein [Fusibacter ferrireducens]
MKPIIGIVSDYSPNDTVGIQAQMGLTNQEWQMLANDYVYSIDAAGGIPVILPIVDSTENIRSLLSRLDGVLFTGGYDIDPSYYNQLPSELLKTLMPNRDHYELSLAKTLLSETHLPVLGICRGAQVLNVAAGGSLYQDLSLREAETYHHPLITSPRHHPVHTASIVNDSIMYTVFQQDKLKINSYHHQAIDRLADAFSISMTTDDGVVEAFEMDSSRYVVGVQWHPEMMTQNDAAYLAIFKDFVRRCTAP